MHRFSYKLTSHFRRAWTRFGWWSRPGQPLRACGQAHLSLSIHVVDDDVVRQYNRAFRQEDAPTDVLSFAVQEGSPFPMEMPDELAAELAAELGDLLLAFPYASGKAQQHGHSLAAELQLLVVHGDVASARL